MSMMDEYLEKEIKEWDESTIELPEDIVKEFYELMTEEHGLYYKERSVQKLYNELAKKRNMVWDKLKCMIKLDTENNVYMVKNGKLYERKMKSYEK